MAVIDPATCLDLLISQDLKSLDDLPEAQGLYALADHRGMLRYIGMTANDTFRKRIKSRHVSGSEWNSHKFACAYNVGRMWHSRNRSEQDPLDGKLARQLRQNFIRQYCKAVCVPLQIQKPELLALESAVLRIAPLEMQDWNGRRFGSEPEPRDLIDSLIVDLGWSKAKCQAIERQATLYDRHGH